MKQIIQKFRRFFGDDRASVSVEVVMVLPIMLWGYFGMFILFEGYRSLSSNIRASYTISDMLSRETKLIDEAYVEGLNDILDILTQSNHRTVLRVTTVKYDEATTTHIFDGSYSTPGKSAIVEANMDSKIVPFLPPMPDAGQLVIVETWMAFEPFLNVGLDSFYFENLVVIRPRFAELRWDEAIGGNTEEGDGEGTSGGGSI